MVIISGVRTFRTRTFCTRTICTPTFCTQPRIFLTQSLQITNFGHALTNSTFYEGKITYFVIKRDLKIQRDKKPTIKSPTIKNPTVFGKPIKTPPLKLTCIKNNLYNNTFNVCFSRIIFPTKGMSHYELFHLIFFSKKLLYEKLLCKNHGVDRFHHGLEIIITWRI